MAQEDSRQEGRRAERWARVNFPNKFVHLDWLQCIRQSDEGRMT